MVSVTCCCRKDGKFLGAAGSTKDSPALNTNGTAHRFMSRSNTKAKRSQGEAFVLKPSGRQHLQELLGESTALEARRCMPARARGRSEPAFCDETHWVSTLPPALCEEPFLCWSCLGLLMVKFLNGGHSV